MNMTFDRNLFTQIGLDSGSLTMLGTVVHSFGEPGEYRGSVRRGKEGAAVFYISVDKNSPVAQVNIDLAALTNPPAATSKCCKGDGPEQRFTVNPKGYAVFHVSSGAGGFDVHVRKAEEDPKAKIFDSRELGEGDIFSAVILRPGTYSVTNLVTKTQAEAIVAYPKIGKTAYRPPAPVRVESTRDAFAPRRIELHPGQGLIFDCKAPSRVMIELVKPDDGPGQSPGDQTTGGTKKASIKKRA
jgi:hypothetical protein